MDVVSVLHMNVGNGESSYARNSSIQRKVLSMTKHIREQEIINLCCSTNARTLSIADLGCSSGPNTLLVISQVMDTVHKTCKKVGKETPEFQIYLNDLLGNDFNTLFQFFQGLSSDSGMGLGLGFRTCFVAGVPGSFYDRLFPMNSLHFIHSSYSVMWLSQVPNRIEDNKGNIYMASTSPESVLKAYYEQFQKDFSVFLKCRSQELVSGGRMVLTVLGRESEDRSSKECCYVWELIAMALNQMAAQGVIEEEKINSFNIPQYTPSPSELKLEIEKEGPFTINNLEVSTINWNAGTSDNYIHKDGSTGVYDIPKCMRAVAEPLLASHFGHDIINEVFDRLSIIIADCVTQEEGKFYNVVVSMTRK